MSVCLPCGRSLVWEPLYWTGPLCGAAPGAGRSLVGRSLVGPSPSCVPVVPVASTRVMSLARAPAPAV